MCNLIDVDFEEKTRLYSDISTLADKNVEVNSFVISLIKQMYAHCVSYLVDVDKQHEKLAAVEDRVCAMTL